MLRLIQQLLYKAKLGNENTLSPPTPAREDKHHEHAQVNKTPTRSQPPSPTACTYNIFRSSPAFCNCYCASSPPETAHRAFIIKSGVNVTSGC